MKVDYSELVFSQKIAEGGHGCVHQGFFRGKQCAIKQGPVSKFQREFNISALDSPRIAKVLAFAQNQGNYFLVMQRCKGSLQKVEYLEQLQNGEMFIDVVYQSLLGIAQIHKQGIIHKDIKLDNILFNMEKGRMKIKICDFGISRFLQQSKSILGTLKYMAPEMEQGKELTQKVDIWAFGIVLYLFIWIQFPMTGTKMEQPFKFIFQQKLLQLRNKKRRKLLSDPVFKQCQNQIFQILLRLLQDDPQKRPMATNVLMDYQVFRRRMTVQLRVIGKLKTRCNWVAQGFVCHSLTKQSNLLGRIDRFKTFRFLLYSIIKQSSLYKTEFVLYGISKTKKTMDQFGKDYQLDVSHLNCQLKQNQLFIRLEQSVAQAKQFIQFLKEHLTLDCSLRNADQIFREIKALFRIQRKKFMEGYMQSIRDFAILLSIKRLYSDEQPFSSAKSTLQFINLPIQQLKKMLTLKISK